MALPLRGGKGLATNKKILFEAPKKFLQKNAANKLEGGRVRP